MNNNRYNYISMVIFILFSVFPYQSNAITIFIDGMNSGISRKDMNPFDKNVYQRNTSYLMNSELAIELKKKDINQEYIDWNGSVAGEYQTNIAENKLYDRIKAIKNNPNTKNEPINIVSHSYGTVIAYNALEKLNNDKNSQNIKIDSFTTMGSPLGKQDNFEFERMIKMWGKEGFGEQFASELGNIALKNPKRLNNVKQWTNLWAENDNISGKINIPGIKNIQIDKDIKNHGKLAEISNDCDFGKKGESISLSSVNIWHRAYYTPINNLTVKSTGEKLYWNIPKDYAGNIIKSGLNSFKGIIKLIPNKEETKDGYKIRTLSPSLISNPEPTPIINPDRPPIKNQEPPPIINPDQPLIMNPEPPPILNPDRHTHDR